MLIHNYFFPATAYTFKGFSIIEGKLNAIVKQNFIESSGVTDLEKVKEFLVYNQFELKRNNDYFNSVLGLILEDIHDENVIFNNGILFFIDTIFYITNDFYDKTCL